MTDLRIIINRPQLTITEQIITLGLGTIGIQGATGTSSPGGGGITNYERTFTQADLSIAGIFPVIHGLGSFPSGVKIWDDSGEEIGADRIEVLTVDIVAISLSSFMPLQGAYTISITT